MESPEYLPNITGAIGKLSPLLAFFFFFFFFNLSGGSSSKESACNAGVLGSIPGWGQGLGEVFLPGEFHGQRNLAGHSPRGCKKSDTNWALTHTQTINNVVIVSDGQESWVRSLGGDKALEKYSCLENSMDRGTWQAAVHGVAKSQTQTEH